MKVDIGNTNAIEGYYDEVGVLRYRSLLGKRVTTFILPDDLSVDEAVTSIVLTISHHMAEKTSPSWIEVDGANADAIHTYLCEHFRVKKSARRPASWGLPEGDAELPPAPQKRQRATSRATKKDAEVPVGEPAEPLGTITGGNEGANE